MKKSFNNFNDFLTSLPVETAPSAKTPWHRWGSYSASGRPSGYIGSFKTKEMADSFHLCGLTPESWGEYCNCKTVNDEQGDGTLSDKDGFLYFK